ncbi:hypothetical protein SBY92_001052 [Candida maltosa Xu316]
MFKIMPPITSTNTSTNTKETTKSPNITPNNSPISTSDNTICQWYCCSCGQSYGTVLYKDDHSNQNQQHQPLPSSSSSTSSSNYILDNLKYYSQVVYRDHKHVISNSPSLSGNNAANNSSTNYFECKQPTTTTTTTTNNHQDYPDSPTLSPIDLNNNKNNLIDYQEKTVLNIPTRFTCHRCSHMMCPYCPKLRLKDLD